ncbi:MAG TPA: mechanosensitive ion channel family protein [Dissulfurispiraceae bacterium]|nr:mechanosensitive ion channel family protein [Dissulfurispiraceae bacterium]
MSLDVNKIFIPAVVTFISVAAMLMLRGVSLRMMRGWAAKTATKIDDIVNKSIRTPSLFWCLAVGLYIGIAVSELPDKYVFYLNKALHVIVVLSFTMAAANLVGELLKNYVQKSRLPLPSTGLFYGVVKGLVIALGVIIALGILGISITPLITALGVGGLAVALALKDTLENFFSGIHILVEKSIRVGDFIKLETGQEGYVEDITWRTTRIRMLPNNMVVIPNSKLSQSIVTNYYLPEQKMSLQIPISVSYSSDPDHVEELLIDEAGKAAGEVPGLLEDPPPFVRFIPGFGDSALEFTLICQVREFVDQYNVQHELRKRILKRFRAEHIEIPFPQRTINIKREGL